MSEVGFTKGTWSVGKAVNGNWIECNDNGDIRSIGRTFYEHTGSEAEDANAHLIAAAPDLYEALHTFVKPLVTHEEKEAAFIAAVFALAKARGETK